ncbi:MAG: hypothetical protein IJ087_14960 [Eggerthellaceae bacterium]|nr:hypothetical protein [Eggerthellaceae bacterium]
MLTRSKLRRSIVSSVVAVAMAGSLSLAPAIASARQEPQNLATGTMSAEVPEWAIDDGGHAQEGGLTVQAAIPSAYDLHSEGLVTPVKLQNPWGSCWAFGGTAAAETSLLSAYGSTYGRSKLDLSERHLTYFALQPISESDDPAQAGEGLHTMDASANAAFDAGGLPVYITTLYSQGVGPMLESLFPYHGKEGITKLDEVNADPREVAKQQLVSELAGTGMSYEEAIAKSGKTENEVLDGVADNLRAYYQANNSYSKNDDWSIPATNAGGASNRLVSGGVVLKNGNVLPEYWATTTDEDPDEEGKDAIKQELLNGRGVSIMYHADQGGPYSAAPGKSANENTNHNQYVYEAGTSQNHGVEIVGWDDAYAKENFAHGDTPGAQAATTPKGDGAWIVKNSWGSQTDATAENADDLGNVTNKGTFGNLDGNGEATGYFYLSYYDKSIAQAEAMEFSANLGTEGRFATLQYDYMPASSGFYAMPASSVVTSSANVFSADDADIAVKSVSTRTSEANTRVTFAIYRLNDNAKDPTDGKMLYRTSQNFAYGGFHRLDLDKPITFTAGTRFSVVSTASTVDGSGKRSYSVSANRGLSKAANEHLIDMGVERSTYSVAVVNRGESYLYDGGEWKDWSEYLGALPPDSETREVMPSDTYTEVCPVDNFSIKVYAEPVDNSQAKALEEAQEARKAAEEKAAGMVEANTMTANAKSITASAKKTTTFKKARAFTVKKAKGAVAFYKVSGNAKIAIGKAGKVTVKKGLKAKKTYKVKVLVVAAGGRVNGAKYAPLHKTVTLTVRVR